MSEIASKGQLRVSLLRWAVVTVPFVLLLGIASGSLAPSGSDNRWYMALAKPAFTPPEWVFPVTWTALYILTGLALAMILHARGARLRGIAITLFMLQLAANLLWSPLFFGAHQVGAALVLIGVILLLAIATTLVFARIRPVAAWLMVPYLAWLLFAGALTWRIDRLNPQAESLVPPASATQIAL